MPKITPIIIAFFYLLTIFSCKNDLFQNYYNEGLTLYKSHDYRTSISKFDTALTFKANPHMISFAYGYRGKSKFSINDYKGAIEDFKNSLNIAPSKYVDEWLEFNYLLGKSNLEIKDYPEAIFYFNKVIQESHKQNAGSNDYDKELMSLTYSLAFKGKAEIEYIQRNFTSAILDCDSALLYDSKNSEALILRGSIKKNTGDSLYYHDWWSAAKQGDTSAYSLLKTEGL